MRMYSQPRISFIKRFFYSFSSPGFYVQIIKEPLSKAVQYSILLTAVLSIITSIFLSFEVKNTFLSIRDFVNHPAFPDITIDNGKLVLTPENNLDITLGDNKEFRAIIESGKEKNYMELKEYASGIFISPEFITFQNRSSSPILIRFDNINSLSFRKSKFLFLLKYSEYLSYFFLLVFYFIQLCIQYFFKSFILYFMAAWLLGGFHIKELQVRGKQVFSVILYAMSLATIVQELFYLMRPSNQYILAIFIVTFYLMTMKITRNGLTAILLDRLGKENLDDMDEYFS